MLTLIQSQHGGHKFLNVPRYVIRKQSNGVYLAEDKGSAKGSFLELPRASLVEYDGETVKVYGIGKRDLTDEEKRIRANMPSALPENAEKCKIDMLTDGSFMFWADKAYLHQLNADYMAGHGTVRGLRYDFNENKIWDETLKGEVSLTYTLKKI